MVKRSSSSGRGGCSGMWDLSICHRQMRGGAFGRRSQRFGGRDEIGYIDKEVRMHLMALRGCFGMK